MTEVKQSDINGESGTGFEKRGTKGPFECGNCGFFDDGACHQVTMKKLSKQPRNTAGFPKVDEEDCCEYVERIGHHMGSITRKLK
jgi:hypothetical protein